MFFLRVSAVFGALALLVPSAQAESKKDALSKLTSIDVNAKKDDIVVTLAGTKAPDFTSFTMSSPFRVVVDWAGSRIQGAKNEKFDRGLIRSVSTKQFDSEAEKISRVTIELSRETAYHVEADGTKVSIHFEPVPDPIPEKEPERSPRRRRRKRPSPTSRRPADRAGRPDPGRGPAPREEEGPDRREEAGAEEGRTGRRRQGRAEEGGAEEGRT